MPTSATVERAVPTSAGRGRIGFLTACMCGCRWDAGYKQAGKDKEIFAAVRERLLADNTKTNRGKVHEIQQLHRKMLQEYFLTMDDDGSGTLEEPEIKMLALSLGTQHACIGECGAVS